MTARAGGSRRHFTEAPTALLAACALGLMTSCGGGGGGGADDNIEPQPTSPSIAYSLGAPNAALGQQALAMTFAAPQGNARAVPLAQRALAPLPTGTFVFPTGPDAAGDRLPRIVGDYDRLTERYSDGIGAKLWIDLPASADAHPVALEVARVLQPGDAAGVPASGEIVISHRGDNAKFAGRLRLAFTTVATPVCVAWDAVRDGSFEVERCMTSDALVALWAQPDGSLAIPATVQRAAGAAYAAWARFQGQFELAVAALRMASAQHEALAAAPAGAVAATVLCSLYPPSGRAGAYTLRWLDRNGSGRFDAGDDVRFDATACWQRLDEGGSGPGRTLDGGFELRGYERDMGAAPTYLALAVTDTVDVAGVVTPQATTTLDGGFTARLPGLLAASDIVESYRFDAGNMVAAGGVAARSMAFYADIGDFGFRGLEALIGGATGTRDLGVCGVGGTGRVTLTEGAAPNPVGLSAGDSVRVLLAGCDLGRGGHPRLHSGSVVLNVASVTRGPGADWNVQADARVDLQTVTTDGHTRRLGEFGFRTEHVLGHSYGTGFRPQGYVAGSTLSGVLTAMRNGQPDYQIGCFDAGTFRGTWDWSDFQLRPNQVVKTAGRVFTIGMREGESFVFKADALGRYQPDVAQAGMSPISAPECVPLGVPATGVSGGDNTMVFDAWPAGDGGRVRLQLNGKDGAMITERWADWLTLLR
jgi:hypothetical protein